MFRLIKMNTISRAALLLLEISSYACVRCAARTVRETHSTKHTTRTKSIYFIAGLIALNSVVVNSFADNGTSSCGNITVNNDASNTCYNISPPEVSSAAITINGTEAMGEWTGAKSKNLQGTMTGSFKVLRSSDAIFLTVTVNDSGYNASDVISLYFDPRHNHAVTADDIQLHIKRDNGGSPNHEKFVGGVSVGTWNPGSALAVSDSGASWTIEVKVSASELGVSDLPAVAGFGIRAVSIPNSLVAAWPVNFDDTNPSTSWANLKDRFPLEYMLVLDQSGSMLDPSTSGGTDRKWDSALTAADYMANTMGMLQDSAYFNDQLCTTAFAWSCGGGNVTSVVKACASVGAFPVGHYTSGIADPLLNNCTPIGSGLNSAFNTIGVSASEETQRVTLLLSDGLHNRPDSSLDLSELSYTACNASTWSSCTNSNVQVNTVALGQGGGIVDEALLSKIKDHFAGSLNTSYNITADPNLLKESFIGSLDDLYRMNFVYQGSPANDFVVDEGNQRLLIIASWTTPASAAAFKLQRDTGGGTWVDVPCDAASSADTTVGFGVCVVNDPQSGTWRARTVANAALTANRMFVLLDLNLRARFAVEQGVHGTGMDIILTADLKQGSLPMTNDVAHPVKVTVDIDKPEKGMGTFLTTTDANMCRPTEPKLPDIKIDGHQVYFPTNVTSTTNSQPGSTLAMSTTPQNQDPAAPHMQLAKKLFDACNIHSLPRNTLASLELYDDGTHGDVTANDGMYTLRFNNTQYQGSYVFRFNAVGTTMGGNIFTRTKAAAEYVRVNVDPNNSQFNNAVLKQNGSVITKIYYVIPRDHFDGYMGPGSADEVKFLVSNAQVIGGTLDFNNGMYGQVVTYDAKASTPTVVPVVQDQPISVEKPPIKLWWIIGILILLVLLLLWLLMACRSRNR